MEKTIEMLMEEMLDGVIEAKKNNLLLPDIDSDSSVPMALINIAAEECPNYPFGPLEINIHSIQSDFNRLMKGMTGKTLETTSNVEFDDLLGYVKIR